MPILFILVNLNAFFKFKLHFSIRNEIIAVGLRLIPAAQWTSTFEPLVIFLYINSLIEGINFLYSNA